VPFYELMFRLKKKTVFVNITLNYQVVGFDIACHEAIITFNDKFN